MNTEISFFLEIQVQIKKSTQHAGSIIQMKEHQKSDTNGIITFTVFKKKESKYYESMIRIIRS